VNLRSIEKTNPEFAFSLGVDRDFVERTLLVVELGQRLAQQQGFSLFGTDPPFCLPQTITADLLAFIDTLIESNDGNARDMSMLVAEALQGHEEGLEYLYLRSKTFTTNRPGKLQV
jgi:hypothetical protein